MEMPPRCCSPPGAHGHCEPAGLGLLRELGFNLREIAELLSLNDGDCNEARLMAEHKLEAIRRHMGDLHAMAQELAALIAACREKAPRQGRCAIIATLNQDKGQGG